MAALAVGGHILGTMAGIASSRTQEVAAKAQAQAAAYNFRAEAAAAKFNAKVAKQMAAHAKDVARAEAGDFERRQSARLAASRAERGGSGVVNAAGSPLMVEAATVAEVALGRARIIHGGEVASVRLNTQAQLLKAEAKTANINARLAIQSGNIAASGAKLGAFSAVAQGAVGVGSTLSSGVSNVKWFG